MGVVLKPGDVVLADVYRRRIATSSQVIRGFDGFVIDRATQRGVAANQAAIPGGGPTGENSAVLAPEPVMPDAFTPFVLDSSTRPAAP